MRWMMMACALALSGVVAAEDMPTYHLELKDGTLNPARLVVPAGQRFKLVVKNSGKSAAEFESLPLRKEKVLAPGVESFVVFQGLSAGEYKFFDDFHPATARGVIVVK